MMRTARGSLLLVLTLAVMAASCEQRPKARAEPSPAGSTTREQGPGTATLRWSELPAEGYAKDAPDPVAGFRVYLGPSPDALKLEAVIDDPKATNHVVNKLPKGKHYYAITTYTRRGIESEKSPVVSKEVE